MRFLFYTAYIICSSIYLIKAQDITIGKHSWMLKNLETTTFRNGDIIQEATNKQEMLDAFVDKKPVWCYYDFNPKNGEKYGKLYNWYAVNDSRGLAPSGYRIPSESEFRKLLYNLNQNEEDLKGYQNRMIYDSILNNIYEYAGGITQVENFKKKRFFVNLGKNASWWSAAECKNLLSNDDYDAWGITFSNKKQSTLSCYFKGEGLSVRCIKVNEDDSIKDTLIEYTPNEDSNIISTLDGIELGNKNQTISWIKDKANFKEVVSLIKKITPDIDTNINFNINLEDVSTCLSSKIPNLEFDYIKNHLSSIIVACYISHSKFIARYLIKASCLESLPSNIYTKSISKVEANTFCDCVADKSEGVEINNESLFPCYELILNKQTATYNSNDIIGPSNFSAIRLLNIQPGNSKYMSVIMGESEYFFLFDTGASTMLINKETELEWIKKGFLSPNSYVRDAVFELADRSKVKGRIFNLNKVKVGDYVINNVEVGVTQDANLLCGLSLLNKFKKWEFDSDSNTLKLFK